MSHRAEEDICGETDGFNGGRLQSDLHQPTQLRAERLNKTEVKEDGRRATHVDD